MFSEESLFGKQEAMFEVDGKTYIISNMGNNKTDPIGLRDVGTRISCDTLGEVTGQKIEINKPIDATKSFISGNKLSVECIEPLSGVAIDYLPREFYEYNQNGPRDIYEFYDRFALQTYKMDEFSQKNIKYVNIPWTADHCTEKNGKRICENNPNINIRKTRLRKYITEKLKTIM